MSEVPKLTIYDNSETLNSQLYLKHLIVTNLQDAGFAPNGNSGVPISEGMNGVEVERRMNQSVSFR